MPAGPELQPLLEGARARSRCANLSARRRTSILSLSMLVLAACGEERTEREPRAAADAPERPLRELVGEIFEPLPERVTVVEAKRVLGRRLFHDRGLSRDRTVSCA